MVRSAYSVPLVVDHREDRRDKIVSFKRNRLVIVRLTGCSRRSQHGHATPDDPLPQRREYFALNAVKKAPGQHDDRRCRQLN